MPTNDYILRTKATGVKATKTAVQGLTRAVGAFTKTVAPLLAVASAMKAVKDSVMIAQQIKPIENSFKSMTKAAGMSTSTLNKLTKATDGTVGSMELMKQANNVMMLGVADSEEQMSRMFDTAQRLAEAVGKDATYGIESLVTGLGRQSKLMLDNLGIMVDVEKGNKDYAGSLGKTASELTDAEKKQAFINAALENADEILARIGPEQETFQRKTQKLSAALEDMGRSVGEIVIPVLSDAIDIFYNIKTSMSGAIETAQNVDWSATWGNFLDALPDVIQTYRMIWSDIFDYIVDLLPAFWQKFKNGIVETVNFMWSAFQNLAKFWIDPLVATFGIFVFKTKKKFQEMWADMKDLVLGSLEWIVEQFNKVVPSAIAIDLKFGDVDRSAIKETETMIKSFQDSLAKTDLMETIMGVTDDSVSNATELFESINNRIDELKDKLIVLKEEAPPLPGTDPDKNDEENENLNNNITKKISLHKKLHDGISKWWKNLKEQQVDTQKEVMQDFIANTQLMAQAGLMGKKEAKMIAKAENVYATMKGAAQAYASFSHIKVVGHAMGIAAALAAVGAGVARGKEIEKAQFGYSGMVDSPTTFLAGEAGAEMVNVTPLEGPNLDGPQGSGVTVNLSGNVISSEFVEEELPSLIQEAIRKGVDFNLA